MSHTSMPPLSPVDAERLRRELQGDPPRVPLCLLGDAPGRTAVERYAQLADWPLSRSEAMILADQASSIVAHARPIRLVELGIASPMLLGRLIDVMATGEGCWDVSMLDECGPAVRRAAERLEQRWPSVRARGVTGWFLDDLDRLGPGGRRLICVLGPAMGQVDRAELPLLLSSLRDAMAADDTLLVGSVRQTPTAPLRAGLVQAADVAHGFLDGVRVALGHRLGVELSEDDLAGQVTYDPDEGAVELGLRARRGLAVNVASLGLRWSLEPGQVIRALRHAVLDPQELAALAEGAGLRVQGLYTIDGVDVAIASLVHAERSPRSGVHRRP